ncbi:MAG: carboxyl-terminal processing protease [Acidobacteriota bacterium]|jgi:carboxyl-terminal processing protease|nr:carboxyl-terminal processing protease [Acidobacteriota bacterium]
MAYLGLKPQALCLRPFGALPDPGKEIVELVRDRFMDAEKSARWAERHAGYAKGIEDRASFRDETRRILAELETSHTQYYLPEDPGYYDLLAIFESFLKRDPKTQSLGLATAEGFVVRAFAGGPAANAGLRRGDRIVSQAREDGQIVLEVQSRRDEPSRIVRLTPRLISPKEEWLENQRAGSRVIEHKGRRIAYAPLWSCAGEEHQDLLEEAMQGDFAEADALVIDFRGGWGGCNPGFVQLFDPAAPDLTRIDRDGTRTTWSPSWRKPLAILIDGGTRSGKEVVSRALQRSKRAKLVGERTAGAVVAGQINLLSDGSLLFLAVQDIVVDGERLEGVGVKPDVEVPAGLEYAEGRDPQLERALEVLAPPGVETPG